MEKALKNLRLPPTMAAAARLGPTPPPTAALTTMIWSKTTMVVSSKALELHSM